MPPCQCSKQQGLRTVTLQHGAPPPACGCTWWAATRAARAPSSRRWLRAGPTWCRTSRTTRGWWRPRPTPCGRWPWSWASERWVAGWPLALATGWGLDMGRLLFTVGQQRAGRPVELIFAHRQGPHVALMRTGKACWTRNEGHLPACARAAGSPPPPPRGSMSMPPTLRTAPAPTGQVPAPAQAGSRVGATAATAGRPCSHTAGAAGGPSAAAGAGAARR